MSYLLLTMDAVTAKQFWQAVGEQLLIQRTRKGWNPIDVERAGGPNYATVQAIERGEIGRVDKLAQHAKALSVDLVDVMTTVLKTDAPTLAPEERLLIRKYQTSSLRGRRALVAMAEALEAETPEAPSESRGAVEMSTTDTRALSTATRDRKRAERP